MRRHLFRTFVLILSLGVVAHVSAADDLPPLPEAVASFGAAVNGHQLYVYGGHMGKTHQHSLDNLSSGFYRLDLEDPAQGWENLGEIRPLQGLPLIAVEDRVCRVGGLDARNSKTEDEDLHSIADVQCYTPNAGWNALPSLPQPRSSHDAVVLDHQIYVIGGWQLRGQDGESVWRDHMAVLDLASPEPAWRQVPQPFTRRALAVAAAGGKVYAFGGLDAEGTSRRVDVFDPATETWTLGPDLPAQKGRLKGFGVSAFGVGDRIYLSGADGQIHAFDTASGSWQVGLGQLDTPRFFHRLLPARQSLLFLGGAASDGHLDSVEERAIASLTSSPTEGSTVASTATSRGSDDPQAIRVWAGFRGDGSSHAAADLPLTWTATSNVAWRAPLPGYGQSSPVIWGDQAFITSVLGDHKETLVLSALDLETGELRWRRRFQATQAIESSQMVSRGAPTPIVDAKRVYAFWESGDLIALDHDGETLWTRSLTKDYGPFAGNHGVGSSPVQTEDMVIVQVTHDGPSYFVAIDKASGENRWKVDREPKVAWTTPAVARTERGVQIISSASGRLEALDGATGERLWLLEGFEKNNVPSVTVDDALIVVASSDAGHNLAIRWEGRESVGEEDIVWRGDGITSGFGSPVVHRDCVIFVNKSGTATCADRRTGEARWRFRLPDAVWASPITAGDLVYFFTKQGETVVLSHNGESAEQVALNALPTDDTVFGVAAIPGAILIRTGQEIIRVGSVIKTGEAAPAQVASR